MVIKSLWKLFISLSNANCKKAVASESGKCYGLDLSKAVSNKKGCITFFEIKKTICVPLENNFDIIRSVSSK